MWFLSSLYPLPVLTALVASSGVENSKKKYLQTQTISGFFNPLILAILINSIAH